MLDVALYPSDPTRLQKISCTFSPNAVVKSPVWRLARARSRGCQMERDSASLDRLPQAVAVQDVAARRLIPTRRRLSTSASLRTTARTWCPCSRRRGTTCRPTIPVAPITATCIIPTEGGQHADLSQQTGKIMVETLASHQTVTERYHDRKRKPYPAPRRLIVEKSAVMDALIPGLGDHESAVL